MFSTRINIKDIFRPCGTTQVAPPFSLSRQSLIVQGPSLWTVTDPTDIYIVDNSSSLSTTKQGYEIPTILSVSPTQELVIRDILLNRGLNYTKSN